MTKSTRRLSPTALAALGLVFSACYCENRDVPSLARPSELQHGVWTRVAIEAETPLYSPPFSDAIREVVVFAYTRPAGLPAAQFVEGEERDPDRLREVSVLDERTMELSVKVPPGEAAGALVINISLGESQWCGAYGTHVVLRVSDP